MANNSKFKMDELLWTNPEEIKKSTMEWLAERQAQKRYSKDIDLFILNEAGTFNKEATKLLLDLSRKQSFNDEIFYKTEKSISYNDGKIDNAEALWLIDYDGSEPIVTLSTDIISKTIYKNSVIEVEILKQTVKSNSGSEYFVVEHRSKDEIKTFIATGDDFSPVSEEDIPEDIINSIQFTLETKEWKLDFEPFVYIANTPEAKSDANFVQNELDDLVVLAQKKRDDVFFSSVKVVTNSPGHNNKKKEGNLDDQAETNMKKFVATGVFLRGESGYGDSPATTIANAVPNTDTYDRAIRTTINSMLKKTGGATDVDSKGTVQQSKGEVLMSQGDEYKVSKWKAKNRQEKIRELFNKLWKVYTTILKVTKPFSKADKLFVIISQEEVLSETEMLENLKKAEDYGYTHRVISYARYNGLNVIDAYDMMKMELGALNEK